MSARKQPASGRSSRGRKPGLAKYRARRDFAITPEPSGASSRGRALRAKDALTFVIQKHAATRLHYDFRLELDGVLKSWAVAKGPSYNPADKRLAVEVEDHPFDYRNFEGIIPQGQYGGGTVLVWDRGTWEPIGDPHEGLRKGDFKFVLHGEKLRGRWVLVRMHGRHENPSKPNWLLIKERDQEARGDGDPPVTEAEPDSVLTGRDLDAIARAKDAVWNSNRPGRAGRVEAKPVKPAAPAPRRAARRPRFSPNLSHAQKEKLPAFIPPQLATLASTVPAGDDWIHELKLDGYRIEARVESERVQLFTRTGLDWTHRMPSIADAVAALPVRAALLDGEVVVLAADGTTCFADLQAAFQERARHQLTYFIFDFLHLDGHNLRDLPLLERKQTLRDMLAGLPADGPIRLNEHISGSGTAVFDHACKLGAEGIISKLARGKYVSARASAWLKRKCGREQEFVIGGFTLPSNGTRGVGALLLGYYDRAKLVYAGRTGTGFTQKLHRSLRDRLDALHTKAASFDDLPPGVSRGVQWVRPELVAQVAFANWTADHLVRQAAFKGLREDKPAKSVRREEEKNMPRASVSSSAHRKTSSAGTNSRSALASQAAKTGAPLPIRLTHPDKVLDPESGLTKEQLARYYAAIAPHMLPHIAGRPLSLVRCPDGIGGPSFFQKHVNRTLPPVIESVDVVDKKTGQSEPYITLSTPEALIALAQSNVLEIHAWGSANRSLEKPDRIVIDLDPDPELPWKTLTAAAGEVRRRLKSAGLESFLKTTGGKGLHVVAPIRPEHPWAAVKDFAHGLVLAMESDEPALFLTRMTKSARKGKIFLDYLRNERGATSVAPFSPRAREGAPVALPLSWSELKAPERPVFTVPDFARWQRRLARDPWKGLVTSTQRLKIAGRAAA
jgi:bifunctional non-homologous end joining protein LigD